jgi:transposase
LSTSIGGIIDVLKQKAHTPVEVSKSFPSTKTCSECGNKQPVALSERTYICQKCNNIMDRDHNAGENNRNQGLKDINVPAECRELTPVEILTSTSMVEYFNTIPHIQASLVEGSRKLQCFSSE